MKLPSSLESCLSVGTSMSNNIPARHATCQVRGYGLSADAHHITQPEPGGRGAILAMQRALDASGLDAASVAYINAHATSTQLGDAVEAAAIAEVWSLAAAADAEEETTYLTSSLGPELPPGTVGLFAFWQIKCCLSWGLESPC